MPNSTNSSTTTCRAAPSRERRFSDRIAGPVAAAALCAVLAGAPARHHRLPDAGAGHRLAGLRAHRQRLRPRPGRAHPVRAGGVNDAADRACRRPLRSPPHHPHRAGRLCAGGADHPGGDADRQPEPRPAVCRGVPDRQRARLRGADRQRAGAGAGAVLAHCAGGRGLALGGLIYAVKPVFVTALCVVFFLTAITLVTFIRPLQAGERREPPTFAAVLDGIKYLFTRRRLLGVVTLDLFVVLLGSVTALLPIYARDILQVGPIGLGLLRSAPAVGALVTALALSRRPIERHIGRWMFAVVAIYGAATVVFGVSTWFPLSLAALAVLGASDAVSIVVRFSLVQIETPDAMRGRVSAINYLFVGSSNTLGDFESGAVAAWLGTVPAVLIGGIGSLLIAGTWMLLFPDLRRIDRYEPPSDDTRT